MSAQDEMDRVIASIRRDIVGVERQLEELQALRARQLMQVAASPRVVAGPFTLRGNLNQGPPASSSSVDPERLRATVQRQFPGAVLTHASCAAPCGGFCPDDEPPGAA